MCFGLQHFVDPNQKEGEESNDFNFGFHYPDKGIRGFRGLNLASAIPNQENPVFQPFASAPDLHSYLRYHANGYSFLQNLIAYQILADKVDNQDAFIGVMLQALPTDATISDPFSDALAVLMPLFLLLAYIPPVYNMTFKIVREKESRIKETMRIMGMTDLPYWMSWFVFYTVVNTIVTTLSWGILTINVLSYTKTFYIWIFFWLYGQAVFGQIVLLQSLFSRSKYAGIVSTVVYFSGVLVNSLVSASDVSHMNKMLGSLLPQVAIMQGSVVFANYEGSG